MLDDEVELEVLYTVNAGYQLKIHIVLRFEDDDAIHEIDEMLAVLH